MQPFMVKKEEKVLNDMEKKKTKTKPKRPEAQAFLLNVTLALAQQRSCRWKK